MLLGLLAHGYVTGEFEVTSERLGVYLPTEHIDNPKGYADGKDARQFDDRLRGPVDPRELEIDPRSGMKNYIANENGASWLASLCADEARLFLRRPSAPPLRPMKTVAHDQICSLPPFPLGNWDTSSGLVRRTLKRCIEMGRAARSSGGSDDLYEAYRLLGQAVSGFSVRKKLGVGGSELCISVVATAPHPRGSACAQQLV